MIPYMVGKLAPNSSHLTRGLVKYVPGRGPGRGYFRAVPSQNGDKYVTSPPPQSLNLSLVDILRYSSRDRLNTGGLNHTYGITLQKRTTV